MTTVSSGVTSVGLTVSAGGLLTVLDGGTTSGTKVFGGGSTEAVQPGGVASGTHVSKGGHELLWAGGTEVGATISSGGGLTLANVVVNGTLSAGTEHASTVVSGVTLLSGAVLDLAHSLVGGVQIDGAGTIAEATTVLSGGQEIVASGGFSYGTHVRSGGTQTVMSGGHVSGLDVLHFATEVYSAGATVRAGLIESAGVLDLQGFVASKGGLLQAGQASANETYLGIAINSGGIVNLTSDTVVLGGMAVVRNGGSSVDTRVSGGTLYIYSGGASIDDTVLSAGTEIVSSGGVAEGTAVSGLLSVSSGGSASRAVIGHGGLVAAVGSSLVTDVTINNGGTLLTSRTDKDANYAKASGVTINLGGTFNDGGSATNVIVDGGTFNVSSGIVVSSVMVNSGGTMSAAGDDNIWDVTLRSGGILSGALEVLGQFTNDGGGLIVGAIGFDQTTTLSADVQLTPHGTVGIGAGLLKISGSITGSGTLGIAPGAMAELTGTGVASSVAVSFGINLGGPAAVLQIDAADAPAPGATFANTLDLFRPPNNFVDLRSIAYVAGATAVVSNDHTLLTLTDGGNVYKFNLTEGGVNNNFVVRDDGHGGTIIGNGTLPAFVQAAAAMGGANALIVNRISGLTASSHAPLLHGARL